MSAPLCLLTHHRASSVPRNRAANIVPQNVLTIGSTSAGETRLTTTAKRFSDEQEAGTIFTSGDELGDIDTISSFSSYGPTRDGRIKPEVLAPGDEVNRYCDQQQPARAPPLAIPSCRTQKKYVPHVVTPG